MDARSFPDWGKVGRRIGKKLRDILNPPTDNGPSKEERKAQRIHDAHKGFAYFDTFEELLQWSTEDVDLKQQANTPLLARSASAVHDQTSPSTKLMICHDYSGGYHDYESARPGPLPNELYNCVYLQYVDTFIYFSHKLACCPPAAWTNLLHRNGVKVLGTFVVEPQTPGMEGVLEIVDGEYIVAKQLASIARMLGFDGWLLNIEQEFPDDVEDLTEKLVAFIRSLKSGLGPNDLVVWYDALTTVNEVEYQNSLSLKNAPFARAADRLFTNYKWTPRHLKPTRVEANHQGIETSNIHFGIDVWAQNTNMPGPARITYPAKGGGGTNTGTAMELLAQEGFSSAMFAPAWTFEHFVTSVHRTIDSVDTVSMAKSVEQAMWEGRLLPMELGCDCRRGRPHHTLDYQMRPILRYAHEYPAGSSSYFYTDFTQAFLSNSNEIRSCLSSQSILPHVEPVALSNMQRPAIEPPTLALYGRFEIGFFRIRGTIDTAHVESKGPKDIPSKEDLRFDTETTRLCLYKLNMPGDGSLSAVISFAKFTTSGTRGFYTVYRGPQCERPELRYHALQFSKVSDSPGPPYSTKTLDVATIQLQAQASESRLIEFGAFYQGGRLGEAPFEILAVKSVGIIPLAKIEHRFRIKDISVVQQDSGTDTGTQLVWQWEGSKDAWPEGFPWSSTTGPFSHFTIIIDSEEAGTAHCLGFPLRKGDYEKSKERVVVVSIHGHRFGGGTIESAPVRFSRDELYLEESDSSWEYSGGRKLNECK